MRTVIVLDGQSLLDIALQEYGDIAAILWIAQDNNLSLTSDLAGGLALKIRDGVLRQEIVGYYKRLNYSPITGLAPQPSAAVVTAPPKPRTVRFPKEVIPEVNYPAADEMQV